MHERTASGSVVHAADADASQRSTPRGRFFMLRRSCFAIRNRRMLRRHKISRYEKTCFASRQLKDKYLIRKGIKYLLYKT
jgi:hypothetical protein